MNEQDKDMDICYGVRYYPQSGRYYPICKVTINIQEKNPHIGPIKYLWADEMSGILEFSALPYCNKEHLIYGQDHDEALDYIKMYLKQQEELKINPIFRDTFVNL
jgi:hypothetical protein